MKRLDNLCEKTSRRIAWQLSRRSFIAKLGMAVGEEAGAIRTALMHPFDTLVLAD